MLKSWLMVGSRMCLVLESCFSSIISLPIRHFAFLLNLNIRSSCALNFHRSTRLDLHLSPKQVAEVWEVLNMCLISFSRCLALWLFRRCSLSKSVVIAYESSADHWLSVINHNSAKQASNISRRLRSLLYLRSVRTTFLGPGSYIQSGKQLWGSWATDIPSQSVLTWTN